MQFYEFKDIEERVVLIGVQTSEDEDVAASLDELEELAETAGAVTVAKVIQNREAVHPGTYIGKAHYFFECQTIHKFFLFIFL